MPWVDNQWIPPDVRDHCLKCGTEKPQKLECEAPDCTEDAIVGFSHSCGKTDGNELCYCDVFLCEKHGSGSNQECAVSCLNAACQKKRPDRMLVEAT
jgi:hypothetical protein